MERAPCISAVRRESGLLRAFGTTCRMWGLQNHSPPFCIPSPLGAASIDQDAVLPNLMGVLVNLRGSGTRAVLTVPGCLPPLSEDVPSLHCSRVFGLGPPEPPDAQC